MEIKKKIFTKNRLDSTNWVQTSTKNSSKQSQGFSSNSDRGYDMKSNQSQKGVSKLTALLDDDSDNDADFFLTSPDKYRQKHLHTVVNFAIGGKSPEHFITLELSRNHTAKDVIKHLLTQLRKNKAMAEAVKFKAPLTEPEAF